jgi:hypothetical protein
MVLFPRNLLLHTQSVSLFLHCVNGIYVGAAHLLPQSMWPLQCQKKQVLTRKEPTLKCGGPTFQGWVVPWLPHTSLVPGIHLPKSTLQSPQVRREEHARWWPISKEATGSSWDWNPVAVAELSLCPTTPISPEPGQQMASCTPAGNVRKSSNQDS